ncbi:hypothetical protein DTO164E3_139 [Paecilomyces variotii]|nr:hypothetical protein DTO032I3_4909 [Paecilomyces variotii]KAJ9207853.1 hypothetical protein DTO164E3_139 [Paecilomyces variotii]KAJ9246180.1 hypothetical protein DTO169E5_304 [Paecilomyces variotii]KAJ9277111.1 hypothetical protein DTO021D3_6008 [Paecilomyces variotii]KAJ9346381.1 hypothetical protein DTO027B6_1234 [Paecilomyces variotii]
MSDLQKSFAKSRLARLPPEPPPIFDEAQEDALASHQQHEGGHEDDSSSASSASSTGTVVPSPSQHLFARGRGSSSKQDAALNWTDYFAQELYLEEDEKDLHISHHVYITPPTKSGPLFVLHHGAGSSALSFAVCVEEIRKILPDVGILAPDARWHGSTTVTRKTEHQDSVNSDVEVDLRLDTLSRDLVFVVQETQKKMGWETLPDLVLIGHSLGGAVVVDAAKKGDLGAKLLAYAVLDVVEGSAMDALQSMEKYLMTRPTRFPSLSSGIEWHIRSRTLRNRTSARASVPSLLREEENPSDPSRPWVWRTDLAVTKPLWENWFVGMSKKFLEAKGGKLLLLAGTDRLDKELMIGQMQGKYQLQVLPDAGHFIQEDQPTKTAQILVDFYKRNDRSALVLPPKVGDMLASAAMAKGTGDAAAGVLKRPFP